MPPLTDRRIDELFREALDERADALLPMAISRQEMTARLGGSLAQRRTGRRVALVLLAAALLLGLALAALAVGGGPFRLAVVPVTTPSASPSLSTSPLATSSPAGLTVSAWREITPDPLARVAETYPPAWSGSLFVIGGNPLTTPPRRTNDVVFVTSPDGQTWSTSPAASTGYPLAYAFDGDAGVAVGNDGEQAAVWTSPDSRTWTRLANPPALSLSGHEVSLALRDVAHGPAGYVALAQLGIQNGGGTDGGALVLWSPDGRDWQRVPMGPFGDTQSTDLRDIVVVNGRYVISGSPIPTLWTSTDGRVWTKEPALQNGPSALLDLVSGPAGALLAGVESGGPAPFSDHCVAWRSSDGLVWTRISENCPQLLDSPGLVAAPFGFVAATPVPPGFLNGSPAASPAPTLDPSLCAGGVEASTTGEHWTCVPPPPSVGLGSPGDIVAASPTELLAVGSTVQAPGNEIALSVWVADVRSGP